VTKKGTETSETRYYITSLGLDAKRLNQIIRSHRSIENNLHWRLDVVFNEDKSPKRKDNSASNFNIISKIAMTLIDKEKTEKPFTQKKRLKAAWNNSYRGTVLRS
jgi:predicted transposase YbfD/YdcC